MMEEGATEKKHEAPINPEKKSITDILRMKVNDLTACKSCKKREAATRGVVQKTAVVAGTTAVGLGVGVTAGVAALAAAAIAEITIPAILTFKALGLTGGALGFLTGARKRAEEKNGNGCHET